jgi:HK97 family phage major capsid protein
MSTDVLTQLREERDQCRTAALAMIEDTENYDPNSESLKKLEERGASLDSQIERLVKLMDSQAAADALDGRMSKASQRQERDASRGEERPLSWGETFVRSSVFTEWTGRGSTGKLDVETRALPHTLTSMKDALPTSPIYDLTAPEPPPMLIPLTNVITVSTNSIDFVQWVLDSGATAVVPEAGKKPELSWKPTVTSSSLDTIAGTTSFTRQLAEDASAVTSFINGELQREVTKKVEAEAKAALAAATLPSGAGPADAGVSGAIRVGKAMVQAAGYSPSVVVMSSDDSVAVDIASMGQFRGDPYWGLTPVIDPDATDGTVLVLDGKAAIQHYRRNNVQLFLTDSHADAFVYNILWALAEQRCKTVVTKPAAGAEVTAG